MIDVERLLGPIREDSPTGDNLRLVAGDQTIAQIEELRREEDPAVDLAGEGKDADWPAVVRASEAALAEKSKDLQLAAHLTEGLTHTEGFEGLAAGLQVVTGLLDRYWDQLHPGWEEGEVIQPVRSRWIAWLGTSQDFLRSVKSVPLTSGGAGEARSWASYEESVRVDEAGAFGNQSAYNEMVEGGMTTGELWKASLAATSPEAITAAVGSLGTCVQAVGDLLAICNAKFTEDPPGLTGLRDLLQEIEEHLKASLPAPSAAPGEAVAGVAGAGTVPAAATEAPGGGAAGPIGSREDAYERLRTVSDYLKKMEPHSPAAGLLDRVIRWRDLSFAELLKDVFHKNKDARATVMDLLGIEEPKS